MSSPTPRATVPMPILVPHVKHLGGRVDDALLQHAVLHEPTQFALSTHRAPGTPRPCDDARHSPDADVIGQGVLTDPRPVSGQRTGRPGRNTESSDATKVVRTSTVNDAAFSYYPRLHRVKTFVESHLSEHISLEDAARVAAYETTYFCSWFHRRAGLRFTEWLALERVERAIELIRTSDRPMWDVARTVGFTSLRSFERAFKRGTLLSPKVFQSLVRPS